MAKSKPKLLIIEDDAGLQRQLAWTFEDYTVLSAGNRDAALGLVTAEEPPVITLDLGLPPDTDGASEGFATLEQLKVLAPHAKVIVVTGSDEREHALKAVAMGAYDFYQKPIDADTIRLIVDRALKLWTLEAENRRLRKLEGRSPLAGLVTASPAMLSVCSMIEKVAPTSVTVLLLGESGTGKEVIARALHGLSPRAAKPFIAINCAAIPETLLESELFGHEKGAFTGAHKQVIGKIELADGGTLFLDEIGDMPMPLQAKLLRFLQQRSFERIGGRTEITVDVRIVCATHRRPEELIKTNLFREDLYYRLSEMVINIPPLRQRPGDALLLARHFLSVMGQQNGRNFRGFSPEAQAAINAYPWPGNVRELENLVRRLAALYSQEVIGVDAIEAELAEASPAQAAIEANGEESLSAAAERHLRDYFAAHKGGLPPSGLYDRVLREIERPLIQLSLSATRGNQLKAAQLLGLNRNTLRKKVRELDIDVARGLK